ncbi:MAG: DUF3018 family protein [Chloroflexi bacterium]|nr:DUF3018 family protein [Chloroflexota bacterium]
MPEPPFAVTMYWPSIEEVREQQDLGLRPVVLWLPACDSPTFVSEARRQLTDLQQSELNEEQEILAWLDSHFNEVWSDEEKEA